MLSLTLRPQTASLSTIYILSFIKQSAIKKLFNQCSLKIWIESKMSQIFMKTKNRVKCLNNAYA
jgi:hypothetical protein